MTILLKIIKNNYSKLKPSLRTSRCTDEAAAGNTQSANSCMTIYSTNIFRILIIFRFLCVLDATNMVKTCDYLYLNNEIHFAKPLKMSELCAGRKLREENSVNNHGKCLYITPLNNYIYIYQC